MRALLSDHMILVNLESSRKGHSFLLSWVFQNQFSANCLLVFFHWKCQSKFSCRKIFLVVISSPLLLALFVDSPKNPKNAIAHSLNCLHLKFVFFFLPNLRSIQSTGSLCRIPLMYFRLFSSLSLWRQRISQYRCDSCSKSLLKSKIFLID